MQTSNVTGRAAAACLVLHGEPAVCTRRKSSRLWAPSLNCAFDQAIDVPASFAISGRRDSEALSFGMSRSRAASSRRARLARRRAPGTSKPSRAREGQRGKRARSYFGLQGAARVRPGGPIARRAPGCEFEPKRPVAGCTCLPQLRSGSGVTRGAPGGAACLRGQALGQLGGERLSVPGRMQFAALQSLQPPPDDFARRCSAAAMRREFPETPCPQRPHQRSTAPLRTDAV